MAQDAKTPPLVQSLNSSTVEAVSIETLTFLTSAGAADVGSAAGTIVYGKLAKAPVLNLLGDRIGEFNPDSSLATSIVFVTGVLDSTLEIGFVDSGELDLRLSMTAARMANSANGTWACDYQTGLMVIKKKTADVSQTITSYKVLAGVDGSAEVDLIKFGGTAVTLGQKTSALSIPVVLPSDAAANSGSASSGDATYMSPTDFTATYASGTTLTITGLPYTPTAAQFMSVKRQDTTGVSVTYTPDVKAFAYNSSTGVLTVTGAAFTATDVFVVTVIGPTKMMDTGNDAQRNVPVRDTSDQYTPPETFTLTNVPNATPDETIILDMSGYRQWSVHVEKTGGADTFDVDYFVSNEDALSTADFLEITPTFASGTAAADHIAIPPAGLNTKAVKLKITTAGGANDADFQVFFKRWY